MASLFSCAGPRTSRDYASSKQYSQGTFHNDRSFEMGGFTKTLGIIKRYLLEQRTDVTPERPIPMKTLDPESLQQLAEKSIQKDGFTVFRLGHSSLLLINRGEYWLIDPVFSERASPVSWAGPKRFHPTPIDLETLPAIRGIIISHDHYDHLDLETVQALKDKTDYFVTPLGVGAHLRDWGVDPDRIHELDWWQHTRLGSLQLVATPSQHFSGRGLNDRNQTLWASWVIRNDSQSIYYSGDSGYFEGFKTIGQRLGPFNLTVIENGAYDRDWSEVHMTPEETLQAHLDLRGKALMPVHNGTFDLALHPWHEPLNRISQLADENQVTLVLPLIGEQVRVDNPVNRHAWWQGLNPGADPGNEEEANAASRLAKSAALQAPSTGS